ncbi:P-loop containing region of AAA domain-containing protein [Bifidobacterium margollesii]|uniref:P-loop containing region of AAA domain-containing protein n=1 Tax=Bifidobacterium margollesii TaxID=2020964 RepID=A0A2N5J9C6_9BIFI|nr:ATP-binding protein [Bifidobacterium margollesii]PLS30812.1 P-loop containing region of AAA domain-containing protein [Bifidobacterium margollesii]
MRQEMQIVADRWMLESRRIVNWGTYDGYHEFKPSVDARMPVTLLAGASESGKSTLVDAQISLLYPTGTPFNKASNAGRSERNDYTYLRGMLGVSDIGDGDEPLYLRGRDADGTPQAVWGAIVDTYMNRNGGERLSCGKFLYCGAGDQRGELKRQYVAWNQPIDPRIMDVHRGAPFTASQLKDAYPGCQTFPNAEAFHAHIWNVMGLSAEACRLLHRIQSADAPSKLDDIFKQGVLGVPEALELAQATVDDYERYDENFRSMEEKARKIELLTDVRNAYERFKKARSLVRSLDPVNPDTEPGIAAIRAWTMNRLTAEVREALPAEENERKNTAQQLDQAKLRAEEVQRRIDEIGMQLQGLDGGDLTRLETSLAQAKRDVDEIRQRRRRLQERFDSIGKDMPNSESDWDDVRRQAAADERNYAARLEELEHERDAIVGERGETEKTLALLKRDSERQRTRHTRISQSMDESRALLARATGLKPEELPYVAELMDVREEDEQWRTAMNVAYGQIAGTILVDRRHEHGFARKVSAIDPGLMTRRTWTFVDTDLTHADGGSRRGTTEGGDAMLSDKLRYREDSPFRDWVVEQTRSKRFDARCVDHIDDADRGRQVQRDGQLKSADRGYHGTKGLRAIIGFVNDTYLDELQHRIDKVETRLNDCNSRYRLIRERIRRLQSEHELADRLDYTTWEEINEAGARDRVRGIEDRMEAMRNDPEMTRLSGMRDDLVAERDEANRRVNRLETALDGIVRATGAFRSWLDDHARDGAEADGDGSPSIPASVTESMVQAYERGFAGVMRASDRPHVIVGVNGASEGVFASRIIDVVCDEVRLRCADLARRSDEAKAAVELRMASYRERYASYDDALTAGIGDYGFYRDELDGLSKLTAADATDAEYDNCLDKLLMDFTQLNRAIDTDAHDIDDQLERINAMLRGQTFGPRHGSLSLHADVRRPEPAFMGQLKRMMTRLRAWGGVAESGSRDDARRLFSSCAPMIERLRQELAQVRDSNGIRSYGARNLDPRCRSSFYAIVHHAEGPDERISSTGGKSGGALQELTSFVYGAALIYLLGGGMSGQPTYATLFLDEALIKADGRYTQRALSVLPRLGFQVIVSAPESKTAEILEVATKAYVAYRDLDTGRSFLREAALDGTDAVDGD